MNENFSIIENSAGMRCILSRYGASLVSLFVPSKNQDFRDVVLGLKNGISYSSVDTNSAYLGCVVGRCANRVKNATFKLNDTQYSLSKNVPPNHLHGELSFRKYDIQHQDKNSITFTLTSKDGEEGFPCEIRIIVKYALSEDSNELKIDYFIENKDPKRSTVANFTNHSYFNLHGVEKKNIQATNDHELLLTSSEYTELDDGFVPTGKLIPVTGTKFDFRKSKVLGVDQDYDLNYSIDRKEENMVKFAELKCQDSGIKMEVRTTSVGCQLYNSVFMKGLEGKYGCVYEKYFGVCLETQYFPNAVNIEKFVSPVVRPGGKQQHSTSFLFSVEKE